MTTGADFAGQAVHIVDTLGVRDTLAINAQVARRAIKIAKTRGWARDALAVQTLLVGRTVHVVSALGLERNTDASLTDFVFWALGVVLAEVVFTASAHTIATETAITIGAALGRDTNGVFTDRSCPAIDIDDALTHKFAEVVSALKIRRALVIALTFHGVGRACPVITHKTCRAILIKSALLGWHTLIIIAAESFGAVGVDHAGNRWNTAVVKTHVIGRTLKVIGTFYPRTLTIDTGRVLVGAVFIDHTLADGLAQAAITQSTPVTVGVVEALANIDAD